jgi:uncharacterized protein (TIGR03435 family)
MSDVDRGGTTAVAGPLPEWDVALVKPHPAEDHMMSWQMTADGLSLVNLPLEQMICSAWDLKPYQVSGLTGWMKSSTFDLSAKVSGDDVAAYKKLSVAQRREMLQKLLVERFQLKVHLETKTLPVYDLVVDKSGSKLKPSTAIEPPSPEEARANPDKYKKGFMSFGPTIFEGTGVPVPSLASQLGNVLGKPVQDETELKGVYDITLHFRREDLPADGGDNADAPSVFSAVQEQLGLKLLPGKGQVETLVVDGAQKPEAN